MSEEHIDPDTGLAVLVKQPAEDRLFSMDFTNLLVGEVLASVNSVTQTAASGSGSVTIGAASVAGESAEFRISGGTPGDNYKITATVSDSGGNTLEAEGMLYVRDL